MRTLGEYKPGEGTALYDGAVHLDEVLRQGRAPPLAFELL
jgi:hypothetical protein